MNPRVLGLAMKSLFCKTGESSGVLGCDFAIGEELLDETARRGDFSLVAHSRARSKKSSNFDWPANGQMVGLFCSMKRKGTEAVNLDETASVTAAQRSWVERASKFGGGTDDVEDWSFLRRFTPKSDSETTLEHDGIESANC